MRFLLRFAAFLAATLTLPAQTYTNPVGGDIRMGDPFALLHDGNYYLYGTTSPDGFEAWRSTNLTDWQPLGYVYRKSEDDWCGKTYWAPEALHYRDRFYLVFSCQPADAKKFSARVCLASSAQPEGPFETRHCPLADNGFSNIDGHIFVDGDGQPYLYYARVGVTGDASKGELATHLYGKIYSAPLKKDLSGLAGEPVFCLMADQKWEESTTRRSKAVEGPYVLRRNGRYYMTFSAGHYADPNYGIGYATADSPLGPWTKSADNPIVSKALDRGISGPGHNSITTSPDGSELFMVYHAHADPEKPSGVRTVNIDRIELTPDGRLRIIGPTRTPQPLPTGAR